MTTIRTKLPKIGRDIYRFEPHKPPTRLRRTNFLHICFDNSEEQLFVIDIKGIGYLLELIFNAWHYRSIGYIGQSTFVAFNPQNNNEIIVGLITADVQIIKINRNKSIDNFCLLQGHQLPPTSISFYKHYCVTASQNETIFWDLKSCMKIHQLKLENDKKRIKKVAFSLGGLVCVLYENDTIHVWSFKEFNFDMRVCLCDHKLRNVKDFVFTKNGNGLIICGAKRKIIILNTKTWSLLKSIELPENCSNARRLEIVPVLLDGGANKIISVLFEDGKVMFLDLSGACFLAPSDHKLTGVRKIIVSIHGQWTAFIHFDGSLIISGIDRLICAQPEKVKMKLKLCRPKAHSADQHLKCIEKEMKKSLKISRLIPILKEFGEYPERHRSTIWKIIMELPCNRKASAGLNNKISVNTKSELLKKCRLANRTKAVLLGLTVDRIVQLFPMLEQCKFLPELVFPFTVVYQKNPLLAFEAVLTILWNYCQKWFEYHPFPPLNILGIIENILMEIEPSLFEFYCNYGVTSTHYAWPLLKTTMSEVLSGNEWLILWDHLLTYKKVWHLLLCVVAYNICLKDTIITLLKSKEDIENFFCQQGQVSVKEIIKTAHRIDRELSEKCHPSQYFRADFCTLPSDGPYPPFLIAECPKFVIENQLQMAELAKLKEEEELLIKKQRKAIKIANEKRLKEECENFMKEIHRQRIEEFKKCYDGQIHITKMSLISEREKLDCAVPSIVQSVEVISPCTKSCVKSNSKTKNNSCNKLCNDVQELVAEVQTFLKSMKIHK